ncbi:uncharacterized protein STEHIDRAFT_143786 [Stereum hirsutum FP-91666 SS1]|uniref:uncharacterized protein n=1 Tax=Stereum hirsutum (strain FP-91666) TaxID=721885 RepID=UPI000440F96B|nr:uncharacterized protein STEHIDRAFT_143786 [Stereum hirsutum FP-91666 SS1]EIM92417.1 hypothetical protein STEHIDRAFT_143786 [Stereum hirsutum FP-91666 SS1]
MISALTLLVLVPLASATITLNVPSDLTSGGTTTITWTSESGDPDVFSLELVNQQFNNAFAIGNNIQTSDGTITLGLPAVPVGDGYQLEAVNISDINDVLGTTGDFAIASATSTSTSASSTSASASSSGSASSASVTSAASSSSSAFGSTISGSSAASTSSGSSTATSASSTPSSFNAASPSKFQLNVGSVGAMLFGAFLGAAVLAI